MSTNTKSRGTKVKLPFFSEVRVEKMHLAYRQLSDITWQILKNPLGATGIAILVVFIVLAFIGPAIAPYDTSNLGEGKWSKPSDFATDSPDWPKLAFLILPPFASFFVSLVTLVAAYKRTAAWRLNKTIQTAALAVSLMAIGIIYAAYLLQLSGPGESAGLLVTPGAILLTVSVIALAKAYRRASKPLSEGSMLLYAFILALAAVGLTMTVFVSEYLTELAEYADVLMLVAVAVAAILAVLTAVEMLRATKPSPNRGLGVNALATSAAAACLLILAYVTYSWDTDARPDLWSRVIGEWLGAMYVFTVLGISLVMVSNGTRRRVTKSRRNKRWVGIVCALAPIFLMIGLAIGDIPVDQKGEYLFGGYALNGVLLFVSGICFHSAYKRPHGVVTQSEKRGVKIPTRIATISVATAVTLGSVLILAGFIAYLTENWTTHWLGTDTFEADIFSKLLYGARTSMIVGIFSAIIASVLGAIVGLYSGYVGGRVDEVIMRANDVVLSIPWLVLMIIVAALLGTIDLLGIILIIGFTGWSPTARMVRAQVLSIRERQYIERARAIGASDLGIIRRHVLPNSFPLVFANTILTVAVSILSEATLSFLGMRPIGVVTWGTMLSFAQSAGAFTIGLHWWIIAPGLCIVLVVLGFTLLGYALDDILNPKLRKR